MQGKFVILHLSDSHLGHPTWKEDSLSVLKPLLTDLSGETAKGLAPDLIVFSGDLVYGTVKGSPVADQYPLAADFLGKIYSAVGKKPAETKLVFAPGNHEVEREVVLKSQTDFLGKCSEEQIREIMTGATANEWNSIVKRQQAWRQFAKVHASPTLTWHEELGACHEIIGACDGTIGIAGMNTSWASSTESEKGKLWLGEPQFQELYNAIRDCDFKIAVVCPRFR